VPAVKTKPGEEVDPFTGGPKRKRTVGEATADLKLKPILDLDEEVSRDTIAFEGKQYELRSQRDLGSRERHQLKHDGEQFSKLWETDPDELGDDGYARLDMLRQRMFDTVLDAPDDVRERFSYVDK
jgi:hypothetical protein